MGDEEDRRPPNVDSSLRPPEVVFEGNANKPSQRPRKSSLLTVRHPPNSPQHRRRSVSFNPVQGSNQLLVRTAEISIDVVESPVKEDKEVEAIIGAGDVNADNDDEDEDVPIDTTKFAKLRPPTPPKKKTEDEEAEEELQ